MVIAIVAVVAAVAIIVGYVGMAAKYRDSYYPNTQVFGMPIGGLTSAEVQSMLDEELSSYSLHITGYTLDMEIPGSRIDLGFTSSQGAQDALDSQNSLLWPLMILQSHDASSSFGIEYNSESLLSTIQANLAELGGDSSTDSNADSGESASTGDSTDGSEVFFDTKTNQWTYKSAGIGSAIDSEMLAEACSVPICALQSDLLVPEECVSLLQTTDTVSQREQAVRKANELCSQYNLTITLADSASFTIDPATAAQWILIDENYGVSMDKTKVDAWLAAIRSLLSGTDERTYTRPDGKSCTVTGGDYGWQAQDLDAAMSAIEQALKNGTSEVNIACSKEGNGFWGLPGADWGKRYVDVDMTEQYARFYDESGKIVWECDVVTGLWGTEYETPTGVYTITEKLSPAQLRSVGEYRYIDENGEEQVEEDHVFGRDVEYWMPFIGTFIGLHDAWWQPDFGGELYKNAAYGSGGCVNLSTEKAAELYGMIRPGDVVVTHY